MLLSYRPLPKIVRSKLTGRFCINAYWIGIYILRCFLREGGGNSVLPSFCDGIPGAIPVLSRWVYRLFQHYSLLRRDSGRRPSPVAVGLSSVPSLFPFATGFRELSQSCRGGFIVCSIIFPSCDGILDAVPVLSRWVYRLFQHYSLLRRDSGRRPSPVAVG